MKIHVRVKTHCKTEKIEKDASGILTAYICKPPIEGQANEALTKLLSEYLNIPKTSISISRGKKSKDKVFEILN